MSKADIYAAALREIARIGVNMHSNFSRSADQSRIARQALLAAEDQDNRKDGSSKPKTPGAHNA
jgi:hypothetical protein